MNKRKIDNKNISINMYITARQFKNAIEIEEAIIIPAKQNNLPDGIVLSFGDSIKLTARGNKMVTKIFPFLVNKAFSCEVYLKLILIESGIKLEELNHRDLHNLKKLYDNTTEEFKKMFFDYFLKVYGEQANKEFLENEINAISNVFLKWRYIYEDLDKENIVNYGFLNIFCAFLDIYARALIQTKYGYDVSKDMR